MISGAPGASAHLTPLRGSESLEYWWFSWLPVCNTPSLFNPLLSFLRAGFYCFNIEYRDKFRFIGKNLAMSMRFPATFRLKNKICSSCDCKIYQNSWIIKENLAEICLS